ncbi:MAG: hypothetical protein QOG58_5830 [Caballeronia sp.]|jgi:hypothetical protein|nr:hypothetical protein [Caballeronia sp.]
MWQRLLRFASLNSAGSSARARDGRVVRPGCELEEGCPRIARGEPEAGSVTGGEACGYPCSEKEGFTHPPLWRAPCFWGTYEWELHAVDT